MFFDGNFKNRRPINLGGINTTYNPTSVAKKDLLKHTEEERIKRELLRRKLEAAIRIQAFFRSKMCIRQWAIQERKTWDQTIQHHESLYLTLLPTDVFISLCRALVFFFKTSEDSDRLIKLIEFSDSNSLPSQLLTHPALFRKLVLHIFWSLNNVSVPKNETQISFLLSLAQHHPSLLHSSEFIFPFEQYLRLLLSKGSCSNESTSLDTKHPPLLPKSLPSLLILIASMHPQSFLRRIVPLPGLMDVFSPTYLKFLRNNFPLLSLLKASEVVYPTSSFSKDFSVTVFLNNFIALSSHQLSLQPFASWAVPYFNLLHRFFKAIPKSDTSFFKDFMEQEHFTFLLNAFSHLPKDAFSVGCDILALFLTHVPLARSPLVVLSITTLPSTLYRHCLMEKQASFSLSHLVKDEGYMNALFVVSDLMYRSISTLPDVDFLSQTHLLPLPDLVQFVSHLKSLVFNILFQSWNAHEHVLKTLVALLQQIHSKRSFLTLCASSDYWLTTEINADVFLAQALTEMPPSRDPSSFISPSQRVLLEIPFVVPFQHRVRLFRHYIAMDRTRFRSSHSLFSDARRFEIRRDHLFEDSFQHFHKMGNNDLKNKITILFVNEFGVPEEGIDGGGVFKEFLNELAKTAFHPNFKLFETTKDNKLYPSIHSLHQLKYYEFLGLLLGKALYESILLETVFAPFFLNKWIGKQNFLDDLSDLDPDVYKNLLFLRKCDTVESLALNFSITYQEKSQIKTVDLIPDGRNIPVDNTNKIKYIYLMADFKLNVLIQAQSNALLSGLAKLIEPEWLRMFNQDELGILISGSKFSLDLVDMRKHTVYSGGYHDNHPVIKSFWKVVSEMTEEDKRGLLCFITSCTRAPLLGFKELNPLICIRNAGTDQERLPTSSTCINLLKLPEFQSEEILKKKLLYSLQSKAGFDLS